MRVGTYRTVVYLGTVSVTVSVSWHFACYNYGISPLFSTFIWKSKWHDRFLQSRKHPQNRYCTVYEYLYSNAVNRARAQPNWVSGSQCTVKIFLYHLSEYTGSTRTTKNIIFSPSQVSIEPWSECSILKWYFFPISHFAALCNRWNSILKPKLRTNFLSCFLFNASIAFYEFKSCCCCCSCCDTLQKLVNSP